MATGVKGGRNVVVPTAPMIAPGDLGQHRRAVDVAGLALVGRHAERGVALEMLGDAEAFARGELHVRHRHVVLEIDEGLAAAVRDLPHRARGDALSRR